MSSAKKLQALDDVSLGINKGETLGLVGESGCGKSTVAKVLLGLLKPDCGEILMDGKSIATFARKEFVRKVQPVFQDPYSSLNPSRSIHDLVRQPLQVHGIDDNAGKVVRDMLDVVGFPSRLSNSYPSELSGGQRQRVAIARALVMKPEILICDEPTSALDVSVQAQVINLLLELKAEFGLTMLFVSHNLSVVEHLADKVSVMYLGKVVEESDDAMLSQHAQHPYTKALFDSTLIPKAGSGLPKLKLGTSAADPFLETDGCVFAPRCSIAEIRCAQTSPQMKKCGNGRVSCHLA